MNKLFWIFFFLSSFGYAQKTIDLKNSIHIAEEKFKVLLLAKNFDSLATYANPKLIEHLGSKQDVVFLLNGVSESFVKQGAELHDVSYDNVSDFFIEGEEIQCSVPTTFELEDPTKKVYIEFGLLLVTRDRGKTWLFAFSIEKDHDLGKKILGLNKDLLIQETKKKLLKKEND